MTSSFIPQNQESGSVINCTTASTFEKPKSLKFELLFGDYCGNRTPATNDANIVNAVDYFFAPGQLFGFVYESFGIDYKKMHHAFVLRACFPGERGNSVIGISPGAEIIVKVLSDAGSKRLRTVLNKLEKNKIDLSLLSVSYYQRLNDLIEIKTDLNYFVSELIGAENGE